MYEECPNNFSTLVLNEHLLDSTGVTFYELPVTPEEVHILHNLSVKECEEEYEEIFAWRSGQHDPERFSSKDYLTRSSLHFGSFLEKLKHCVGDNVSIQEFDILTSVLSKILEDYQQKTHYLCEEEGKHFDLVGMTIEVFNLESLLEKLDDREAKETFDYLIELLKINNIFVDANNESVGSLLDKINGIGLLDWYVNALDFSWDWFYVTADLSFNDISTYFLNVNLEHHKKFIDTGLKIHDDDDKPQLALCDNTPCANSYTHSDVIRAPNGIYASHFPMWFVHSEPPHKENAGRRTRLLMESVCRAF